MTARRLCLCLLVGFAACSGSRPMPNRPAPSSGMAADIQYLTDPYLEGRELGSAGGDSAAVFLADRYSQLGVGGVLAAGCSAESSCREAYLQPFRATGVRAENVVAIVVGSDPARRKRYVIVGAHYDHLGRSTLSALDPERGSVLRVGADDNASGTVALLELGRRLAADPAPFTVVLAHFDAEERGLLGSKHFVDNPPIALDSVVMMLNLDMVGRLRGGALIVGVLPESRPVQAHVEAAASARGVSVSFSAGPRESQSDHLSFGRNGVPTVSFFTGFHDDYHRVSDTADRVDLIGVATIVDLVEDLVRSPPESLVLAGEGSFR